MQSTFDERNWLGWLVKVRIFILTLLLAIELAVAQFSPAPLPMRLFISTILFWYSLSLFYVLLLSFWQEHRLQAALQVLTDLVLVSLVVHETGGWDSSLNFLYPLVIIVASVLLPRVWAHLVAALAFILYGTVLELNYYGVVPSYCTHASRAEGAAGDHLRQSVCVSRGRISGGPAHRQTAASRRAAERRQRRAGKPAGAARKHYSLHQQRTDHHRARWTHYAGQRRRAAAAGAHPGGTAGSAGQPAVSGSAAQCRIAAVPRRSSLRCSTNFRKTLRVRVAALTVPERGDLGYVYVLDDLTEIRRLEREVRMQDRLAAVGRLAAAIAHEIRNPLTSIAGSVSMLSGVPEMNEDHRRLLDIVTRESQRLNSIITDFLAYSRTKQYHFDKVDLIQLVEDTLTLMDHRMTAEKTGITIERRFAVQQAWALADGDKLKQVFWNLCENAVRAMKDGGTLDRAVESLGDDWQVCFTDTGYGNDAAADRENLRAVPVQL